MEPSRGRKSRQRQPPVADPVARQEIPTAAADGQIISGRRHVHGRWGAALPSPPRRARSQRLWEPGGSSVGCSLGFSFLFSVTRRLPPGRIAAPHGGAVRVTRRAKGSGLRRRAADAPAAAKGGRHSHPRGTRGAPRRAAGGWLDDTSPRAPAASAPTRRGVGAGGRRGRLEGFPPQCCAAATHALPPSLAGGAGVHRRSGPTAVCRDAGAPLKGATALRRGRAATTPAYRAAAPPPTTPAGVTPTRVPRRRRWPHHPSRRP